MMKLGLFPLTILMLLILASCQVKKQVSDDSDLVSGHVPVQNTFSTQSPTPGTFKAGDNYTQIISFPFPVIVTGTPRLRLTIGAATRYADYTSGNGGKNLVFTYPIVAGDSDSNGVQLNALELNGGTLQFNHNGTITNCDISTVSSTTYSNVIVDNAGPTISGFAQTNVPGFYNLGALLSFTMTFSEKVYVTGNPRIAITFTTGGTIYATYAGGTGTTSLSFTYTVTNAEADIDGYNFTSPLDLNSGTITDLAGNNSSLNYAAYTAAATTYSSTVRFDGRLPYVVSVTPPSNGTYLAAQNLDFVVNFDRPVTITGSPYLTLTIGVATRQAAYLSGSTTSQITFRYITVPGDVDSDGIALTNSITANGGTIVGSSAPAQSYFLVAQNNLFSLPVTTGILLNSIQPQATSLSRDLDTTLPVWGGAVADDVWNIGQSLMITVNFNTNMYVTQTGGSPRIPLTIGATTRYATYLSGGDGQTSLIFRYTVQEGDLDTDTSIALGSIDLNGGVIADSTNTNALLNLPTASLTTTSIDGVRPTLSSITPPTNGTYSTVAGNNHLNMTFTANWSEAVNYSTTGTGSAYLPMTIGATGVNAEYASGNNTAAIVHRATSLAGQNDSNGITLSSPMLGSATISDRAGNTVTTFTYTTPNTSSINVDTVVPSISSVTAPANGTYNIGDNLDFTVTFSESVTVNVDSGYPRIPIVIGATTRYLVPTATLTSTVHTFRYALISGEEDTDGITVSSPMQIGGAAYIRDIGQNATTLTFTPPTTTGVLVDAVAPLITGETAPSNGTYTNGDTISFTVTYDEIVNVTGTPRIQATAQTGTINFNYASGTGTNTLTFSHTVTTANFDFDGLSNSITTIALNLGTIRDVNGNDASLTLTTPQDLSSVFLAYPNTAVWTTNDLVNKAPTALAVATSVAGAATMTACSTQTCREFNGDDVFSNTDPLNNVRTIFIVFVTPTAVSTQDLITGSIILENDTTVFDLTADGTINLDGSTMSGILHDVNMGATTTHILQVDFSTAQNFSPGDLIPASFAGAIGDIIVIDGVLSGPQKTEIQTYLNTKY